MTLLSLKEPPAVSKDPLEMDLLNTLTLKFPVTREALITAQKSDFSLAKCFSSMSKTLNPYFLEDGVLMVAGNPNQVVPLAPLCPIPAFGEPFEHVIMDCVGP